jgi:hypothetical protein
MSGLLVMKVDMRQLRLSVYLGEALNWSRGDGVEELLAHKQDRGLQWLAPLPEQGTQAWVAR